MLERPGSEPDFEQHRCLDKGHETGWGTCIDHGYTSPHRRPGKMMPCTCSQYRCHPAYPESPVARIAPPGMGSTLGWSPAIERCSLPPTDWQQLQFQLDWLEQRRYGLIRPVVVFGSAPVEAFTSSTPAASRPWVTASEQPGDPVCCRLSSACSVQPSGSPTRCVSSLT